MRKLTVLIIGVIVVFGMLQLVRPSIPTKPAAAELQAPPEVRQVLDKNCYSCHSDQRRLAWFDELVPAYWLVRHDILTAREHLNFSTIGAKPFAAQRATLFEAVNMIQLGAMPLPSFRKLHPEANVTPEELTILKSYLAPWSTPPAQPTSTVEAVTPISLNTVQPEFNNLPFDAAFETWKPISTTDRGDNNSFRFILGNETAIRAAQSGNITPWPDGARFAKIAWQQELGADGLIHPGKFIQVELMIKNAHTYKDTEGWGWGRWRGLDLKPYGTDAGFVKECTSCHLPVRGNDYVYTLPITTAKVNRDEIVNNAAAALPSNLPYQPLGWGAITMYVDPKTHTTATLYANDIAMNTVQPRNPMSAGTGEHHYPGGTVLALVTWFQRDDPHWFGARIPHKPESVEFVTINAAETKSYSRYDGNGQLQNQIQGQVQDQTQGQTQDQTRTSPALQRSNFILSLTPAPLP